MRPLRVLKRLAVQEKAGLSKTALYQKISEGTFPKPVRLGRKAVGWIESELDQWIAARVSERDGVQ